MTLALLIARQHDFIREHISRQSAGQCFCRNHSPEATRELISEFYGKFSAHHQLRAKPRQKKNLHVTLHSIPLLEHVIESAKQACEVISKRTAPFSIQFEEVMTFNGSALVLGQGQDPNQDLHSFHRLLGGELTREGFRTRKSFSPHITLADGEAIERQIVQPIGWTVDEFVLIYSFYGKSEYLELGHWPLTGPDLPSAIRTETNQPEQPELALF